jgi:hypothetical protein
MSPDESKQSQLPEVKLFNRSFYRFFFSFIAVVAGALLFILVLGSGSEI